MERMHNNIVFDMIINKDAFVKYAQDFASFASF